MWKGVNKPPHVVIRFLQHQLLGLQVIGWGSTTAPLLGWGVSPLLPPPLFPFISFLFFFPFPFCAPLFSLPPTLSPPPLCYHKYLYPGHLCGLTLAGLLNDASWMTLALTALETTFCDRGHTASSKPTNRASGKAASVCPLLITQVLPGCKRNKARQFSLDMWFPHFLSLLGQASLWAGRGQG